MLAPAALDLMSQEGQCVFHVFRYFMLSAFSEAIQGPASDSDT